MSGEIKKRADENDCGKQRRKNLRYTHVMSMITRTCLRRAPLFDKIKTYPENRIGGFRRAKTKLLRSCQRSSQVL